MSEFVENVRFMLFTKSDDWRVVGAGHKIDMNDAEWCAALEQFLSVGSFPYAVLMVDRSRLGLQVRTIPIGPAGDYERCEASCIEHIRFILDGIPTSNGVVRSMITPIRHEGTELVADIMLELESPQ